MNQGQGYDDYAAELQLRTAATSIVGIMKLRIARRNKIFVLSQFFYAFFAESTLFTIITIQNTSRN
jgi:hypothetical protein